MNPGEIIYNSRQDADIEMRGEAYRQTMEIQNCILSMMDAENNPDRSACFAEAHRRLHKISWDLGHWFLASSIRKCEEKKQGNIIR